MGQLSPCTIESFRLEKTSVIIKSSCYPELPILPLKCVPKHHIHMFLEHLFSEMVIPPLHRDSFQHLT